MATKKKYRVTLYYHTKLTVSVEAESEKEAIALADVESEKECYRQDLLDGLSENHYPYVEEDLDDDERLERIAELKRKLNED